MDFHIPCLFHCALCGEDKLIDDAEPLDNCTCLFCHRCLTVYLAQQLENKRHLLERQSFEEHFEVQRTGTYVDDEGLIRPATVEDVAFRNDWEDSSVTLTLEDGGEVTSTYWRVAFADEKSATMSMGGYAWVECPGEGCYGIISKSESRTLCPDAFDQFLEAETIAHARLSGCIRCPYEDCRCLIERLDTGERSGKLMGSDHGEHYRFRCAGCQRDFCGVCFAKPYHTGFNCLQFRMPNCRYCEQRLDPVERRSPERKKPRDLTIQQLKRLARHAAVDSSWCLEKSDFVFVAERIRSVCNKPECRGFLKKSCTKKLPCGHGCCGVGPDANDPNIVHRCLPCFEPDCPHSSSEFDGCQICWESFATRPCIELSCKHLIHLECARERLMQGYPGPSISFNHLYCSMCGTAGRENPAVQIATSDCSFDHPLLKKEIQPVLQLRERVVKLAMARLKASDDIKDEALQPGGEFHGRPADFALKKYMFYLCSKCKKPYFGGLRDCQAAANNAAEFNPEDLICGSCCAVAVGQNCPRHGTTFIEWKCRYCCDVACWFCWGTTHFCDPCHRHLTQQIKPCRGEQCPLKVEHPKPGTEFCLGCALCRHRYE